MAESEELTEQAELQAEPVLAVRASVLSVFGIAESPGPALSFLKANNRIRQQPQAPSKLLMLMSYAVLFLAVKTLDLISFSLGCSPLSI